MKVVILCGGRGTRIRSVSQDEPKPMIPVGGRPILWHVMNLYARTGRKDFILCLGYKAEVIKQFFTNYRQNVSSFTVDFANGGNIEYHDAGESMDWRVTLAETGLDTMTGSRLKRIQKFIGPDELFCLTYGDGLCDVNIDELEAFHRSHGKIVTVTGVRPPGRFGELEQDDAGTVTEFNEKPQASGGRISGGFFVCDPRIFDYLDASREDEVLEAEPLRRIARDGEMMLFEHDGFWQAMDTYRDFMLLNELCADGCPPWEIRAR